jgi:hypothetical protein
MVARRTSVEKSLLPIPTGFLKNHFFSAQADKAWQPTRRLYAVK